VSESGQERRTCSNCGAELDTTVNFCPNCGAAQEPQVEIPEGPPPPISEPGRIEAAEVPGVPPSPAMQPLVGLAVGCGAILLLFLVALVSATGSDPEEEQAASEETTEEPTEEPTEVSKPSVSETYPPEDKRPTPRTPEERLRRNIEDVFTPLPEEGVQGLEDLQIQCRSNGCLDAYVAFEGSSGLSFTRDWTADGIESQMRQVYEAAYSDDELRRWVCTVRASASGVLTDSRGKETTETLQTTSMSGETADTINWRNATDVDFPNIWTVEYTHPALEQQGARDALDQAVDCLDDGGLFDFDWAECP
jgi:hypothetical protein